MDGILFKVKDVLISPDYFFRGIKREKGLTSSFIYYAVLSLFGVVFSFFSATYLVLPLLSQYTENTLLGAYLGMSITEPAVGSFVFGFFAAVLLSFVFAGLLHLWCLLFGGKGSYTQSYKLLAYSQTPKLLFSWIPGIGVFAGIYSLVLIIIGTQRLHNISRTRAIIMYVLPYIFALFILIAVVVLGLLVFKNLLF
ncbi:MAG: hypothetical protein CMH61_01530 [Nanoarchaeota archaeon]|nr:hypothetical protein [Nanoarchaeota archaeon]|tara:strand:+ start:10977 stop:11564 length:588 start_codon:yes stop_codon:yes gene_type:complete